MDNYTILRFPSRCTKVTNESDIVTSGIYDDTEDDAATIRIYTENILKVELPDTVKELGEAAFSGVGNYGSFNFSSLERIELSKNISKIETCTFVDCKNLKYVKMPENITEIGPSAFYGCKAIESITIPEGVKKIGERSFEGCTNLQQINLPGKLEKIGANAFYGCKALESITIPEGIKEIETYSFFACINLQKINLPEGLESIGEYAFSGTRSLSEIIIPESVKTIDSWAFSGWTASQTIKCKATKAGDNWDKYWNYNPTYPASSAPKISANIIWGYQDNNT